MPSNQASRFHPQVLAVLVLLVALLATWFAYAPGIGGDLHFDDEPNLQGLATVRDSESAFRFVATGVAGPLGRPIALASFVPQAHAWPSSPEVFLRANILIHLLNGLLVTWFLYLLGRVRLENEQTAALVAAGAGAIWMLLPLLASSSLLIVQRMTTLSALFTLLGGVAYLYARQAINRRPIATLLGMTLAIGAGAVLGALAKENGVLLFVFILAAEATLLDRPLNVSRRVWHIWFSIVLIAPFAALVFYLASILPYSEGIVLRRGFNGFERLLTQAEILWKYLYLAFLPNMPSLGPFHDDYPVQRSILSLVTLLSAAGWIAVISAAVIFRRKAPLFSFAVAWYLAGHLLESTTISLELYFEHRNYLPLIGPVYALVASLGSLLQPWRRLAIFGGVAYAVLLASILYSTTSLWGSPALAGEMWHIHKPHSLRAAQYLANNLASQGNAKTARRVLERHIQENTDAQGAQLEVLFISCQLDPESDHRETIQLLDNELATMGFTFSAVAAFERLYELAREGRCKGVDHAALTRVGLRLLENPRFNLPIARHNIHAVLAMIGIDQRNFGLAISHMEEALKSYHNPATLLFAISILNSGGRNDIAFQLLAEAKDRDPPRHPIRAYQWKKELNRIERDLLSLERRQSPDN